jgi:hypothetical protein
MAVQASLGLYRHDLYRDPDWIQAAWWGNDGITLLVVVPMLILADRAAARGSSRAALLMTGAIGYALYNDAFYLFGATLNAFFLLYVVILLVALLALIGTLSRLDTSDVTAALPPAITRLVGVGLCVIAAGLSTVWIAVWAAHVFAGRALPLESDAFRLVAALDLSFMVPTLAGGGILLLRRRAWGVVLAAIGSVQAALYLLVLSTNSVIAMTRTNASTAGELPIWGSLAILTTVLAATLFASLRRTTGLRLVP